LIVIGRAAHAGELQEERALRQIAQPCLSRKVSRSEAKVPTKQSVGITFKMRPIALQIAETWAGLKQQHIESLRRQLFGNHSAATTCSGHNHVSHTLLLSKSIRSTTAPEVTQKFIEPVRCSRVI